MDDVDDIFGDLHRVEEQHIQHGRAEGVRCVREEGNLGLHEPAAC